jgi:P27 family predicted phage terminase small subunit
MTDCHYAPRWLDEDAKKLFNQLYPNCKGEETLLVAYCQAYAELKLATKTVQEEGRYITTDKGFILQHPATKMMKQATSAMNQLSVKLGFDKKEHSSDIDNLKKWTGLINEDLETR